MYYYKKFLLFIDDNDYDSARKYIRDMVKQSFIQKYRPHYYFSIFYVFINTFLRWGSMTNLWSIELGDDRKFLLLLTIIKLVFWQIIYFNILELYYYLIAFFYARFKPQHYDFVKKNIIRDENYILQLFNNIDITFITVLAMFLGCVSCFLCFDTFTQINAIMLNWNSVFFW